MESPKADACLSSARKEQRNDCKRRNLERKTTRGSNLISLNYWLVLNTHKFWQCFLRPHNGNDLKKQKHELTPTIAYPTQCLDCQNPPYKPPRIKTLPYEKIFHPVLYFPLCIPSKSPSMRFSKWCPATDWWHHSVERNETLGATSRTHLLLTAVQDKAVLHTHSQFVLCTTSHRCTSRQICRHSYYSRENIRRRLNEPTCI